MLDFSNTLSSENINNIIMIININNIIYIYVYSKYWWVVILEPKI